MSRRASPYTQSDVTRLIKAALAAGVGLERIAGVTVNKDGATILFGNPKQVQSDSSNPWDEVLNDGE